MESSRPVSDKDLSLEQLAAQIVRYSHVGFVPVNSLSRSATKQKEQVPSFWCVFLGVCGALCFRV